LTSGLFSLPLPPTAAGDVVLRAHPAKRSPAEPCSFIAGPENALVRSLATAATAKSLAYNPIVLCGPAGVGKSSVGQALFARRRDLLSLADCLSTTATDLIHGLAEAIETNAAPEYRVRHQRCNLLFIDDVHRLADKPAAQQFLIATLDALLARGVLVIATLRQFPQATEGLLPGLASRLAGGLLVRLSPPGLEARRELVAQEAARLHLKLTEPALLRLAGEGPQAQQFLSASRVRQAVIEAAFAAQQDPLADAPFEKKTKPSAEPNETKIVFRHVASAVAKHFSITLGDLKSKSRRQALADARGMAIYIARRLTGASYAAIGRSFGGRDHTTVLHAHRKVTALINRDDEARRLVDDISAAVAAELGR
jgi:chromosomal replication initiator protein